MSTFKAASARETVAKALERAAAAIRSGAEFEFFSWTPAYWREVHDDYQSARENAESYLNEMRKGAGSDGWPEEMGAVKWGIMIPIEHAVEHAIDVPLGREADAFDEWCDYTLEEVQS